jgi:hypothetical protein
VNRGLRIGRGKFSRLSLDALVNVLRWAEVEGKVVLVVKTIFREQ